MVSIFTRIFTGDIPGRIVWNDDQCGVIVDVRPLTVGHCLVVPKREVDHWTDLTADEAAHLMRVASIVANAQRDLFAGVRIGLMIAGFEVRHAHLHVTPIDSMADLDFANADKSPAPETLDNVAFRLRDALRPDYPENVPV